MILQGDWRGCYRDGWQGLIVPDAFAHPAKFSRSLIRRIYDHMREEGWLPPGSVILDPFGGVALGALDAMQIGCYWIGLELEEKFVTLGAQNIALWNARFSSLPGWGSAVIVQGDSRKLLAWNFAGPKVDGVVGSPPFNENKANALHGQTKGFHSYDANESKNRMKRDYVLGDHPSNLGNLPDKGFDAAVGSPPYAESLDRGTVNAADRVALARALNISNAEHISPIDMERIGKRSQPDYGFSPGQLAAMKEGQFEGVVSSPSYGGNEKSDRTHLQRDERRLGEGFTGHGRGCFRGSENYGSDAANTGNMRDETFWSAARQILDQCFLGVRPGGHAVFVTKRFIRKGKVVEFSQQWQQLCEAVGFRCVHVHRALLVEDMGTQGRTDAGETRLIKERKSFFRRLAEKKGSPRIDWEEVQCFERP